MSAQIESPRSYALDALRGLTVAMMILVNTPGSWEYIYAPFQHADWHGCTPTDLVFPFFLFIVGGAMFFSFRKRAFVWTHAEGMKIFRRTCIIFAIGLFLNTVLSDLTNFSDVRIMGVLQRIALAYAVAAVLVLCVNRLAIYLIAIFLLLSYWLVLYFFGGNDPYALVDNAVLRTDLYLLGDSHLWQGKGIAFDPEGLLSTLPAIVNVLIGFEITRVVVQQTHQFRSVWLLVTAGIIALLVGLDWHQWFPINKSLWTSSFVIYTAGYFALILAFFIWLIDIKRWDFIAKPFIIYGANPLFIYVLAAFWVHAYTWIPVAGEAGNFYTAFFLTLTHFMQPLNASLAFAIIHVVIFWLVSLYLYKKKIWIKI